MATDSQRRLKTGGDPRTLADYATLRDELNKLTHPARPDVNWQHAEKLCLSLFEHNGVELQTAAWYTLVRTQLAGAYGLNEGLAILDALISRQWGALWPQQVHARMEILSGLSRRLQQALRTLTLTWDDLSQLYVAEQHLTHLNEVMQRLELKHLSQIETLRAQVHAAAVRLENSEPVTQETTGVTLPLDPQMVEIADRDKWVYVVPEEPKVARPPAAELSPWIPFFLGMSTMLLIACVLVWGWKAFDTPDTLRQQYALSLSPLPMALNREQLQEFRQNAPSPEEGIRETQQQLERLSNLPPEWSLRYREQLIQQAQALWPEQAKPLAAQWRQQLNASLPTAEQLNSWNQGMTQLQALTQRLNTLDEKRGKYMTVSELKSEVFSIIQAFNAAVPLEEQLRQLGLESAITPVQRHQAEASLEALLNYYSQFTPSPFN